jgi:DNA-directed RNA polymerase specialized sigma24 family protein
MPDDVQGSVTRWIAAMKGGDLTAAQGLWERYFARMINLARARLRASRGRDAASDEEDAALSAFDSMCAGLVRGQYPQLADREDLWRLLVVITTRKVMAQARRRLRVKRGGGSVRTAADLANPGPDDEDDIVARAIGSEPTPEFAATVAEEYRRLLERLDDDALRQVAVLRMEGNTSDEIAGRLGCARRTVARQLALIRRILASNSS